VQGISINFTTQTTPATASNFSSLLWTHTGTGTIFNANTLSPTYQPGTGETGAVTFTLTANGNGSCAPVADQLVLTITPSPLVNAGSNAEVCEGLVFDFSSRSTVATSTNFSSLLWTSTGTGVLTDATTLNPSYTPGVGETGNITFTLTATGNGSCSTVTSQMVLTITPSALVNAGSDLETCQGISIDFTTQTTPATASNFSSLLWTHTGTGTIFNANTLSPTYQPGTGETGAVTFTLTANGNGSCAPVADQLVLTITPSPLVNAGSNAEVCEGLVFDFSSRSTVATSTNFSSLLWTSTGTGVLTDATTLNPSYTPGVGETGNITFTLTATGNGSCSTVTSQMVLTITPSALVNAGSDLETCQGISINFTTQTTPATASNFSSLLWTHTGTGTIFNANTLSPTYQPGTGETGAVTFTLTANGNGSCAPVADQLVLTITPSPLVNAGSNAEVCEGLVFDFSSRSTVATSTNFSSLLWTSTGTGVLTDATTLNPSYTPGVGETGNITFTLTATGNGSCSTVTSQMVLTITPSALVNAGSDLETCQGISIDFTTQTTPATASNFSSLLWTHTGTGTIFNANTLSPTYQPGTGETGAVTFTLTANGNGSCAPVADQLVLTITPSPLVNAGQQCRSMRGSGV
jgi:predicted secreted protein